MKTFTLAVLVIISVQTLSQVHVDRSISEGLKHSLQVIHLELSSEDSIPFLTEFSRLESLTLINFKDSIAPLEVGKLLWLKELRFVNDNFKYIPENYADLNQLERIDFIENVNLNLQQVFSVTRKLSALSEMRLEGFTNTTDLDSIRFPEQLSKLSLRNNHLTKVPNSVFKLPGLKVLDLGGNDVFKLENLNAFSSISILFLDHQTNLSKEYSPSFFKQFKNIDQVYLPQDDLWLEEQAEKVSLLHQPRFLDSKYSPNLNLHLIDKFTNNGSVDSGKLRLNINSKK